MYCVSRVDELIGLSVTETTSGQKILPDPVAEQVASTVPTLQARVDGSLSCDGSVMEKLVFLPYCTLDLNVISRFVSEPSTRDESWLEVVEIVNARKDKLKLFETCEGFPLASATDTIIDAGRVEFLVNSCYLIEHICKCQR